MVILVANIGANCKNYDAKRDRLEAAVAAIVRRADFVEKDIGLSGQEFWHPGTEFVGNHRQSRHHFYHRGDDYVAMHDIDGAGIKFSGFGDSKSIKPLMDKVEELYREEKLVSIKRTHLFHESD